MIGFLSTFDLHEAELCKPSWIIEFTKTMKASISMKNVREISFVFLCFLFVCLIVSLVLAGVTQRPTSAPKSIAKPPYTKLFQFVFQRKIVPTCLHTSTNVGRRVQTFLCVHVGFDTAMFCTWENDMLTTNGLLCGSPKKLLKR